MVNIVSFYKRPIRSWLISWLIVGPANIVDGLVRFCSFGLLDTSFSIPASLIWMRNAWALSKDEIADISS